MILQRWGPRTSHRHPPQRPASDPAPTSDVAEAAAAAAEFSFGPTAAALGQAPGWRSAAAEAASAAAAGRARNRRGGGGTAAERRQLVRGRRMMTEDALMNTDTWTADDTPIPRCALCQRTSYES